MSLIIGLVAHKNTSLDIYGKEVYFGISFGSLAPISREIARFKCVQGKSHPYLPTLPN